MLLHQALEVLSERWHPPALCFLAGFVGLSQLFAVLDAWQPAWYRRCSVVAAEGEEIPRLTFRTWRRVTLNNARNIALTYLLGAVLCVAGPSPVPAASAGWLRYAGGFLLCYLWGEQWFWWSHWAVHHPRLPPALRRRIHGKHHEFRHTYAIVGLYCSWEEMAVVNWPLSIVFPLVWGVQTSVFCGWMLLLGLHIANNHSMHWLLLPRWLDNPAYHYRHHREHHLHYGAGWVERYALWLVGDATKRPATE